jgi:hypothetical protein
LATLEKSAQSFCNGLYQKEFKEDAPWHTSDVEEMIKLKIKSADIPTLNSDGQNISIHEVTRTRGKFRAKVSVFPRIYAPHLKSQAIKKGKKALRNNKAKLNLQLVHLAMADELKSSMGEDLEKALGYKVSNY